MIICIKKCMSAFFGVKVAFATMLFISALSAMKIENTYAIKKIIHIVKKEYEKNGKKKFDYDIKIEPGYENIKSITLDFLKNKIFKKMFLANVIFLEKCF